MHSVSSRGQYYIILFLIPNIHAVPFHFSQGRNQGDAIDPFWQKHKQKTVRHNDTCIHSYLVICVLMSFSNWACQSNHPGNTFPIGIISLLDSERLQCMHNYNGKETQMIHFFSVLSSQSHVQSATSSTNYGSEWISKNKQRVRGK